MLPLPATAHWHHAGFGFFPSLESLHVKHSKCIPRALQKGRTTCNQTAREATCRVMAGGVRWGETRCSEFSKAAIVVTEGKAINQTNLKHVWGGMPLKFSLSKVPLRTLEFQVPFFSSFSKQNLGNSALETPGKGKC